MKTREQIQEKIDEIDRWFEEYDHYESGFYNGFSERRIAKVEQKDMLLWVLED